MTFLKSVTYILYRKSFGRVMYFCSTFFIFYLKFRFCVMKIFILKNFELRKFVVSKDIK